MRFLVFGLLFLTAIYVSESRSVVQRDSTVDVRAVFLKQVSDLYDKIKGAIDSLAKTDKKALVTGLQEVIKFVKSVDEKVKALKPTTDLGKYLVKTITKMIELEEKLLDGDLKKYQGYFAEDANKEALLKAVGEVFDEGKAAAEKLAKSDKKTLVDALTKVLVVAKEIQADFNALKPTTEIGKTIFNAGKDLVNEIVGGLESQLKALSGKYYAEDHKAMLLKAVSDLYDKSKAAIETLSKTGKKELVDGLEKVIAAGQALREKVKALKPTTDVGKSIQKLVLTLSESGEAVLKADLKKAQGGFYADENKEALLKIAGQIYDEGKAALEKLSKTDKKALVNGLTKTIELVKEVETQMKAMKPSTDLGKVVLQGFENIASTIQTILEEDLKAVQH